MCEGPEAEGDKALRLGKGKNGWIYGPIFPVFYVQDFVRFRVAAQKEAKSLLLQGHTNVECYPKVGIWAHKILLYAMSPTIQPDENF